MAAVQYAIYRRGPDRLDVELRGALSANDLAACELAVRTQLGVAKRGTFKIVVDLLQITDYSVEARDAVVALQRQMGSAASQTAYLTATSTGRALAMWTSHMTSNQVIKCFSSRDDAVGWLIGDVGPASGVHSTTDRAERSTVSRRRQRANG